MRLKAFTGNISFALACAGIYIGAVAFYCFLSYRNNEKTIMNEIDRKLLITAQSIKYMLAPDFHDRAVDVNSISPAEKIRNRDAVSAFAAETDFEYVYTLIEKNGVFYFAAPTVTPEDLQERKWWYFYPYKDIPEEFIKAFETKKTRYADYSDRWGEFRSVALPRTSPGGRTYLACADYKISFVKGLLYQSAIEALISAGYFFLCTFPLMFLFRRMYRAYAADLLGVNRELQNHQDHLEELVEERTRELESEKQKLSHALDEVSALSGLLPICSACKKIRDDQGYWNRIENYIEERSEAQFSHSLCPECSQKLYPKLFKKG